MSAAKKTAKPNVAGITDYELPWYVYTDTRNRITYREIN